MGRSSFLHNSPEGGGSKYLPGSVMPTVGFGPLLLLCESLDQLETRSSWRERSVRSKVGADN